MTESQDDQFKDLIPAEVKMAVNSLAEKPTNNDLTIRLFYEAVSNKINAAERLAVRFGLDTDDRFINALSKVIPQRLPQTSPDFIAKAIFQFYQYTNWFINGYQAHLETPNFFATPPSYMNIPDARSWEHQLDRDFADDSNPQCRNQFREIWTKTMMEDTIPTTIAQRYAGIRAIYAQKFGDRPITVADIGCGTMEGLKMLKTNSHFEKLRHDGTGGMVTMLMDQPLNIERGIGIDLQDFTKTHARLLAMACRYTPSEFYRIAGDMAKEMEVSSRSHGVEFRQGNFLTDDNLLTEEVDAISISTILYQIATQEARWEFIEKAKAHLRPGGIVVAQDFAIKDPENLDNPLGLKFGQAWDKYYTYVLPKVSDYPIPGGENIDFLAPPQQLFIWAGGRCREVEPGEDFNKFFDGNYPSSANAALAHRTS